MECTMTVGTHANLVLHAKYFSLFHLNLSAVSTRKGTYYYSSNINKTLTKRCIQHKTSLPRYHCGVPNRAGERMHWTRNTLSTYRR